MIKTYISRSTIRMISTIIGFAYSPLVTYISSEPNDRNLDQSLDHWNNLHDHWIRLQSIPNLH